MIVCCQFGSTALLRAVNNNRFEIVEVLLKAGADTNFKNKVSALVRTISLLKISASLF